MLCSEGESVVRRIVMPCLPLLFIAFATLITSQPQVWSQDKTPAPQEVAATVNGIAISRRALNQEVQRIQEEQKRLGTRAYRLDLLDAAIAEKKALEKLIDDELLYQASKKAGITVEDADIDRRLEKIRKRFPDEGTFHDAIVVLGMSEDDLKNRFRRGMAVQGFVEKEFAHQVEIPEKTMRRFYDKNLAVFKNPEQLRASHILIKAAPDATEAEKKRAHTEINRIIEKIKQGEDFAALAQKYSEGSSGPSRGGDVGYFRMGQMEKPFEDAAFALQPGEVSGVVETRFGYHVIKVTERKPENTISYEEAKPRLTKGLKGEMVQDLIEKYTKRLRAEAKVEILGLEKKQEE